MSNAKLLRQLIKAGIEGDSDSFKAASEAVIREEREKKHHLLANDLERLLYGERSNAGRGHLRLLPAKELPINKDSGLALVEGLNFVKRHMRKSQDNPQGGIIEKEAPLALGKLRLYDEAGDKKKKAPAAKA